jgi:hypothetical protein
MRRPVSIAKAYIYSNKHARERPKAAGREESGLWMPRADAGGPRRTGGYVCHLLLRAMECRELVPCHSLLLLVDETGGEDQEGERRWHAYQQIQMQAHQWVVRS